MTDLQVRNHANELKEEELKLSAQRLAHDTNVLQETKRANRVKEEQSDNANLARYGYQMYFPVTREGAIGNKENAEAINNIISVIREVANTVNPLARLVGGFGR